MATITEERQLLSSVANADRAALACLYKLYYPRLERFIGRMTLDKDIVGDIINEVFLVIWQKAGKFKGESSPSTWILGIAYNKSLKWASREKHHDPLDQDLESDNRVESLTERSEVNEMLNKLSPEQRAVMELTHYFGYSYREISELLGCPENTVKTRMFYARRLLLQFMKEDFT